MNDETVIDSNLLLLRSPDAKPSGPPAEQRMAETNMSDFARGAITGVWRNRRRFLIAIVAVVIALLRALGGNWTQVIAIMLIAVGVVLNLVVIYANGGRMPAQMEEIPRSHEEEYRIMDSRTRLGFLGDWIPVWGWLLSPGDVCLYAGCSIEVAFKLVELFFLVT